MTRRILIATLALMLALPGLAGAAMADSDTTTVTLRVAPEGFVVPSHWAAQNEAVWLIDPAEKTTFNDQDGIAGCVLEVPDQDGTPGIDGAEVLDHATETGCISGWDAERFACCGRFVTSVDGREQLADPVVGIPAVWWLLQHNGQAASVGIDGLNLQDGDSLGFVYYVGV